MTIKQFWKENKRDYLWSCFALIFLVLFIGMIKNWGINNIALGSLIGVPLMLITAFGIYTLTGGDKE